MKQSTYRDQRNRLSAWLDAADELLEQLEPTFQGREFDAEVALERQLAGRD